MSEFEYVGPCADRQGNVAFLYKRDNRYYRCNPQTSIDEYLKVKKAPLTVLSFGGGQDSAAILFLVIHDKKFREKYVEGKFIVVMSDTGDEHPETYEYVKYVSKIMQEHKIPFYFLTPKLGFHQKNWQNLIAQLKRNNTIIMRGRDIKHLCTMNLKITPIYKWLDEYCAKELGWGDEYLKLGWNSRRKKAIQEYANKFGRIRVLIGFAAGEEKRAIKSSQNLDPRWMQKSVIKVFPMIPERVDRAKAQEIIKNLGYEVPIPSNCMICPYMSLQELLWLWRKYPRKFDQWVQLEKNKIKRSKHEGVPKEKNKGVFGSKLLPETLEEAKRKYGHMSMQELEEYKFSHGHNITGGY